MLRCVSTSPVLFHSLRFTPCTDICGYAVYTGVRGIAKFDISALPLPLFRFPSLITLSSHSHSLSLSLYFSPPLRYASRVVARYTLHIRRRVGVCTAAARISFLFLLLRLSGYFSKCCSALRSVHYPLHAVPCIN
jgi:hypothetical protein